MAKPVKRTRMVELFRPAQRRPGAGQVTKKLARPAFGRNTYRGGRVSPSEGEASGGGGL